ncbi:MAG: tRNA (adenosine(37)-N6)-threonylcarbamoyltransferase complex dimerization subunit type 1 TsaB [Planctomycetes bacterium]|nr:tRNA (adenosine(37)-N6)-threonylcarbamoyltransferase complex dimerization subunit type 1 TsaB [Planctomycetota bacterium]
MIVLGIETSSRAASVALLRDDQLLDERSLEDRGKRHGQTLVAEAARLFRTQGIKPQQCDLVAVSIGPGSFTGLRIGVVFAKTFAYAVGCPVAAVDTFLCVAETAPAEVSELFVIGDAQRQQLFVGRYERRTDDRGLAGVWRRVGELQICDAETWGTGRSSTDVVTGPGLERFAALLAHRCRLLPPEFWHPTAGAVAQIGRRLAEAGQTADLWTLQPLYVRKSAAEEKWEAQHGSADVHGNG